MKKNEGTISEDEFTSSESDEESHPLRLEHGTFPKFGRKNPDTTERNVVHVFSFLLGATLSAPFMVIICSAEDMLSGSTQATGLVVIAITAPSCLMKVCFLLFEGLRKTSSISKTLLTYVLVVIGMLSVAFSQTDYRVRYVGVCLVSLGFSVGEIGLIVAAKKFHERALSSLITGSAVGGLLSTIPYVGMTSWSDINPRAALLVPIIWPSLYLLMFAVVQVKNFGKSSYKRIPNTGESQPIEKIFVKAKRFMAVWKALDHLLLLFVSYFSMFLSIGAILTTLVFTHTKVFGPREDYQHYVLSIIIGQFFGRSLMSLWLAKVPEISSTPFQVIGAFFPTLIMFLFFFDSWHRYIHNIWFVFALCFIQGTFLGILTVISYQTIANHTRELHVDFVLILASLLETFGVLCAGLIGLHTEPSLYRHCFELTYGNTSHCLTRSSDSQFWIKGKNM